MDKRTRTVSSEKTGIVVNKRWAAMEASEIAATTAKRFCLDDAQRDHLAKYLLEDVLMKGETPAVARRLAADVAAPLGAKNFAKREIVRENHKARADGVYPVLRQALARAEK